MKKLQRIELIKDLIQEAVDKGATSVEQVHQYIAELPFEALEKTGLLQEDKLQLRDKQRRSIGMVYDAIRSINRQVGELISDQFENLENTEDAARNLKDRERK
jgi:polyhydroxyalkanoate synthesis regulator phasin